MTQKEPTKISLSTFFLLLALVVIIIMAFTIWGLYHKNLNNTNKEIYLNNNSDTSKGDYSVAEVTDSSSKATNTSEKKTFSYSDVQGLYNGTATDSAKDEEGSNRNYELYLYENGTFIYSNYISTSSGYIGNYTIVDNTINLNYLFSTGNDSALTAASGTKTLKINDDGSITDTKPDKSSSSNLSLRKDSKAEDIEYFSTHNVNYLINNYSISNKVN